MSWIRRHTLVFAAVLLLEGCTFKPTDSELVGEWTLTDDSRRLFKNGLRGVTPRLILQSDHAFEASQIPREMVGGEPDRGVVSGRGTWKLGTGEIDTTVLMSMAAVDGKQFEFGFTLSVRGSRRHPILRDYRGDPDQMLTIEFEKQPGSNE